jgi:hypothetical protein
MDTVEIRREFQEVRNSVDRLDRGVSLLTEGLEAQTEMLRMILEAATREPEKSPVADVMQKILTTLDTQTKALVRFGEMIGSVTPKNIEDAVARGIARGKGVVNEDGEILN